MSNDSDSESEASVGSASASSISSSVDVTPLAVSAAAAAHAEPVAVTKLRLQREQRLRRVLSQRHLGQPEAVPHNAFFCTRSALGEEDTVWLYTLTNHRCFEALLHSVASTSSSLAGHLDAVLSSANPLFHYTFGMPIPAAAPSPSVDEANSQVARELRESPLMREWAAAAAPIQRKRPAPDESVQTPAASGANAGGGRGRKATKTASATSGLVAQSLQAWEAHLTDALTKEGETVESFRQARSKTSYTEKKSFQQTAEWNEYRREVALQQQQRDREATRALRRGETDE